ncbi:MAG TPA: SDR family NAD(P)-dependent oxidoreductase [Dehalococcoidia bacterium]|nr:SDR family NAD(P)-dependent oxidoreductase [Dehalococcoidia bacterium]
MADPVAFITGASRGIGKQLAVDFAKRGYDVVCVARSTAEQPPKLPGTVDATADLVRAEGRRALSVRADLSREEDCGAAVEAAYGEFGRIDVLINNAAIAPTGAALEQPKRWRLAVDINLNAPFSLMAEICPRMVEAGHGRVINISSRVAVQPEFGRVSYTSTKRALEGLTESLAVELSGSGVSVNAIRLEVDVWTEGYAFTLGEDADTSKFEDPVVMSDACLWIVDQPADYTGKVVTIADLRELGGVRPPTRFDRE